MASYSLLAMIILATTFFPSTHATQLRADFYHDICPQVVPIIHSVVKQAIKLEPRIGASLLRLHFHDCFVNGCDASVLLDGLEGEKNDGPNRNSARGFEVIDTIKAKLEAVCENRVSYADILALAAREAVVVLGGPMYEYQVVLGRRDARHASQVDANNNLPSSHSNFSVLLSKFRFQGLHLQDLVTLSGAHTIGLANCTFFKERIYNDSSIEPRFAASLQRRCPRIGGENNLAPLDATNPTSFVNSYFTHLIGKKGLLHSDQELFKEDGGESDMLVRLYSKHPYAFARDFRASMVRLSSLKPLTGTDGEN